MDPERRGDGPRHCRNMSEVSRTCAPDSSNRKRNSRSVYIGLTFVTISPAFHTLGCEQDNSS